MQFAPAVGSLVLGLSAGIDAMLTASKHGLGPEELLMHAWWCELFRVCLQGAVWEGRRSELAPREVTWT